MTTVLLDIFTAWILGVGFIAAAFVILVALVFAVAAVRYGWRRFRVWRRRMALRLIR